MSDVHFLWRGTAPVDRFRTGVCLHGHTMYSEECLAFLPRHLSKVPGIAQIVRLRAGTVDFARAYWTPPLAPAAALHLEQEQVTKLGLKPLVSLSDHDNIEAPLALQVTADRAEVPVSVEWTVPYDRSILHLGIHNLPPREERSWMAAMASYTSRPDAALIPSMLSGLSAAPETLIVLNHPFWLEEGVTEPGHEAALERFFRECLPWIHAIELNGTRSWKENQAVIALAQSLDRPVISGGDRHGRDAAACLNLTNAQSFDEFVTEIREGKSTVLFMPLYREPIATRVLEIGWDILRPYPEYPGRERWADRIFYRCADGVARPLSVVWGDRVPWMLHGAAAIVQAFATTKLRSAIRLLVMERGEALP